MTSLLPTSSKTEIFYPSSDGEPLAESYVHLQAIIATLLVLTQYLQGRQATVLADQFLYYAQGFPRLRQPYYGSGKATRLEKPSAFIRL